MISSALPCFARALIPLIDCGHMGVALGHTVTNSAPKSKRNNRSRQRSTSSHLLVLLYRFLSAYLQPPSLLFTFPLSRCIFEESNPLDFLSCELQLIKQGKKKASSKLDDEQKFTENWQKASKVFHRRHVRSKTPLSSSRFQGSKARCFNSVIERCIGQQDISMWLEIKTNNEERKIYG